MKKKLLKGLGMIAVIMAHSGANVTSWALVNQPKMPEQLRKK